MILGKQTKYYYLILLCILLFLKPSAYGDMSDTLLLLYVVIFISAISFHFYAYRKEANWFRIDVIFILGVGIVHFQWPSMIILSGIRLDASTEVISNFRYMNYGTWLATVGTVSWLLGFSSLKDSKKNFKMYFFNYHKLYIVTIFLFVGFLLTAGSNYLSGGIYFGEGGSSAAEGIGAYFQTLFDISILVLTIVVVLNGRKRAHNNKFKWLLGIEKKYLFLILTYILLLSSIGDRGGALAVVILFLTLYGYLIKPIRFREFAIILFSGAFLMTLIGLGRAEMKNSNILVSGANKFELNSGYDFTLTLAKSARTLYKSLDEVPYKHDYFYGKLWLSSFLSIFPFAQSTYLNLSGDSQFEMDSASYITLCTFGKYSHTGEGTTVIADVYLNFGTFGVFIFLFILGVFFKKVQNELYMQQNFYWLIAAGLIISVVFFMGRGSYFSFVRVSVWGLLISFLLVKRKKIIA